MFDEFNFMTLTLLNKKCIFKTQEIKNSYFLKGNNEFSQLH